MITISTSEPAAVLERALSEGLASLEQECGVQVRLEVDRADDPGILRCRFEMPAGAADLDRCRRRLADVLAAFVVDRMEPSLLNRLMKQGYADLQEDRAVILAAAQRQLSGADPGPLPPPEARKGYVRERILRYLEESDRLHIDGLLTFRMNDYLDELEGALDRAVEDLLMEREQREFVALLRYFVDLQEPRVDIVHVVMRAGGGFRLIDDEGRSLSNDDLAVLDVGPPEVGFDDGDLIISALVAIAPRQVLIHDPHGACETEVTDTLRSVFPRRVYVCEGCSLCDRQHRAR